MIDVARCKEDATEALMRHRYLTKTEIKAVLSTYTNALNYLRLLELLKRDNIPTVLMYNPYENVVSDCMLDKANKYDRFTCKDNHVSFGYMENLEKCIRQDIDLTLFKTYGHLISDTNIEKLVKLLLKGIDVVRKYDLSLLTQDRLSNYLDLLLSGKNDSIEIRRYYSRYGKIYHDDVKYLLDNLPRDFVDKLLAKLHPYQATILQKLCMQLDLELLPLADEYVNYNERQLTDFKYGLIIKKHDELLYREWYINDISTSNTISIYIRNNCKNTTARLNKHLVNSPTIVFLLMEILENNQKLLSTSTDAQLLDYIDKLMYLLLDTSISYKKRVLTCATFTDNFFTYLNMGLDSEMLKEIVTVEYSNLDTSLKRRFKAFMISDVLTIIG